MDFEMDVKNKLVLLLVLLMGFQLQAQTYLGGSLSTSKNDQHQEALWIQQELSSRFSAGLQLRYSAINYRFVNARAVEEGSTTFVGLVLGAKLKSAENYRLDFNLTTSYRMLTNDDREELPESTTGLELDPNIIFGLRLSDSWSIHSGAMFRTAMQLNEEAIGDEQLPYSAIVLTGLSLQKNKHLISLRTYAGPMNGATGDTEKFYWQLGVGYQIRLGSDENNSIPFFNF